MRINFKKMGIKNIWTKKALRDMARTRAEEREFAEFQHNAEDC